MISPEDLSFRLKSARFKRWLDKEHKLPKKTKKLNLNTPKNAVDYFNHYFQIGIDLPAGACDEDRANLLFDLANFPLKMVTDRLVREGTPVY